MRQWLDNIGPKNRSLLRHLELAFWNAERAITSLVLQGELVFKRQHIIGEVVWDAHDVMRRVEWCVLTAAPDTSAEDEVKSVGTSILFEEGAFLEDIVEEELEFEPEDGAWQSESSDSSSSGEGEDDRLPLLAPKTPPRVLLTRGNGEEFEDPRWSFAAKFQDHLTRRLASRTFMSPNEGCKDNSPDVSTVSCEPRVPPITRTPRVVLATDQDFEEESESDDGTMITNGNDNDKSSNETVRALEEFFYRSEAFESAERKRYSSASWVSRC